MEKVTPTGPSGDPAAVVLGRAFATRAEQLRDRVFTFYQEPEYFPELLTERPCVLVGGRGTGKTTVLRGLSYQGQRQLRPEEPVASWPYYGVYLRINTGHVAAFEGPELEPDRWSRVFGHYVNLLLCEAALEFFSWYGSETGVPDLLDADAVSRVAETLGVHEGVPSNTDGLLGLVGRLKRRFQVYVNSIADETPPELSVPGGPIEELLSAAMSAHAMADKRFFFLLDEYENLRPRQQQVMNTLIKHAGETYTFKIGVKQLGWRTKTTLNEHEQLQAPADYAAIDIDVQLREPGVFERFGRRVCQDRLDAVARETKTSDVLPLVELLPGLSEDNEAALLGVSERSAEVRTAILKASSPPDMGPFDQLPPLYQYLIGFWAKGHHEPPERAYKDYLNNTDRWDGRYGNYKYSLLFTLRAKRRGIRKYYTGTDAIFALAGGNIRFLVQLVEASLREHLSAVGDEWLTVPVSPEHQTLATQKVAQSNLVELEGLSLIGPRITRLCVGLGRIFQLMAQHPGGHTPEVTQFRVDDLDGDLFPDDDIPDPASPTLDDHPDSTRRLLAEAITHLALIQFPGTKLAGVETRQNDYMLHPIFSSLFVFSHRRKRKMLLSSSDILGLVNTPGPSIRAILARNNREDADADEELPEQMQLFDQYLRGGVTQKATSALADGPPAI
jgi:hypothetical protein